MVRVRIGVCTRWNEGMRKRGNGEIRMGQVRREAGAVAGAGRRGGGGGGREGEVLQHLCETPLESAPARNRLGPSLLVLAWDVLLLPSFSAPPSTHTHPPTPPLFSRYPSLLTSLAQPLCPPCPSYPIPDLRPLRSIASAKQAPLGHPL
jgi:hypothetical protein